MYTYVTSLIKVCPGCNLSNITGRRSTNVAYAFPADVPMHVLQVNIYLAGADFNFDGTKHYLVAADGMTAFGICEPTPKQDAKAFTTTLMKLWL